MKGINEKNFFQNLKLDENGNVMVIIVPKSGNSVKGNRRTFFRDIEITEEGYLKLYEA